MRYSVLIVGAGTGQRFGTDLPKQYATLAGKPVIARTIELFLQNPAISEVICVIHPDFATHYADAIKGVKDVRLRPTAYGGETRSDSVRNGLEQVSGNYVLIHDAARPLLSQAVLQKVLDTAQEAPASVVAVPVSDALWEVHDGLADKHQPRDLLWRGQTPQSFETTLIRSAYAAATTPANDDVEIARRAGHQVAVVQGDETNIKITYPKDLALAEQLLKE